MKPERKNFVGIYTIAWSTAGVLAVSIAIVVSTGCNKPQPAASPPKTIQDKLNSNDPSEREQGADDAIKKYGKDQNDVSD